MPYVERDDRGAIARLRDQPTATALEFLAPDAAEVLAFVRRAAHATALLESLRGTDADLVRVVEDLVDLLATKGVIRTEELPEAVRRKLEARASLRRQYRDTPLLKFDDDIV
ncbi:MAG: hypothetical protein JNK67_18180 [Alphaproteobacteria bacterium]|nr:hypothetical protein [Alphaproteobacteria bacterium]